MGSSGVRARRRGRLDRGRLYPGRLDRELQTEGWWAEASRLDRVITLGAWLLVVFALGWNLAQLPEAIAMQKAPVCHSVAADHPSDRAEGCLVAAMGTVLVGGDVRKSFESAWWFEPTTEVLAGQEFRAPASVSDDLSVLSAEPYAVALSWKGEVVAIRSADGSRVLATRFGIHGALARLYVTMLAVMLLALAALRSRKGTGPFVKPRLEPVGALTALIGTVCTQTATSVGWALVPLALGLAMWVAWAAHGSRSGRHG